MLEADTKHMSVPFEAVFQLGVAHVECLSSVHLRKYSRETSHWGLASHSIILPHEKQPPFIHP